MRQRQTDCDYVGQSPAAMPSAAWVAGRGAEVEGDNSVHMD